MHLILVAVVQWRNILYLACVGSKIRIIWNVNVVPADAHSLRHMLVNLDVTGLCPANLAVLLTWGHVADKLRSER